MNKTEIIIKRKLFIFLAVLMCISCIYFLLPESANADTISPRHDQNIISLKNGDYITVTLTEKVEAEGRTTAHIKTGTKTYYCRNANNVILWSYSISGTFSYDGIRASCTKVTDTCRINSGLWKNQITSTSRSGNTAVGKITIKKYDLSGRPTNTVTQTIKITCSKTGRLS